MRPMTPQPARKSLFNQNRRLEVGGWTKVLCFGQLVSSTALQLIFNGRGRLFRQMVRRFHGERCWTATTMWIIARIAPGRVLLHFWGCRSTPGLTGKPWVGMRAHLLVPVRIARLSYLTKTLAVGFAGIDDCLVLVFRLNSHRLANHSGSPADMVFMLFRNSDNRTAGGAVTVIQPTSFTRVRLRGFRLLTTVSFGYQGGDAFDSVWYGWVDSRAKMRLISRLFCHWDFICNRWVESGMPTKMSGDWQQLPKLMARFCQV